MASSISIRLRCASSEGKGRGASGRTLRAPGARLRLGGGTRHCAGEGRGDDDEREPDRAHGESRFRQRTVQRCHRGGGRREGMRHGAPEDPRPFPETGGGEGGRPPIRRGAGAQSVKAGRKSLGGAVRSVLRRLGGGADMKKEQPPAISL